jgi:hypothetical protein
LSLLLCLIFQSVSCCLNGGHTIGYNIYNMCRYGFKNYKSTFACFKCQTGFKRRNVLDINRDATETKDAKCPNCAGFAYCIGREIRLPKKIEDEQWACIKYLIDHQYNIYSCGCQGIGFVPHKMKDAIGLVKNADALETKLRLREIKKEKS